MCRSVLNGVVKRVCENESCLYFLKDKGGILWKPHKHTLIHIFNWICPLNNLCQICAEFVAHVADFVSDVGTTLYRNLYVCLTRNHNSLSKEIPQIFQTRRTEICKSSKLISQRNSKGIPNSLSKQIPQIVQTRRTEIGKSSKLIT